LDWICKVKGDSQIDFEEFGPHWETFNQLSHRSLVKGVTRLGPNGRGVCSADEIAAAETLWVPEVRQGPNEQSKKPDALVSKLLALLNPRTEWAHRLSFGLSGGLDSRFLLALLMSRSAQSIVLHLFGHPDESDVRVAKMIAENEGIQQEHFHEEIPPAGECIGIIRDFVVRSGLTGPASLALKLRYYPRLYRQGKLLLDGGMGEIARRQFLNRLLVLGRHRLRKRSRHLLPFLRFPKSPIFSFDTATVMARGITRQIEEMWGSMPPIDELGEENFVDLLVVRYRFPNYGGMGQAFEDEMVLSYMPFAQPSCVQEAFQLPLAERRHAKLFRRLIGLHRPSLRRYPLVKGSTTYPYRLTTLQAALWTAAKSKFAAHHSDPTPGILLTSLSEFLLDTIHSRRTVAYAPYDYQTLLSMASGFYRGRKELAAQMDWWLAFEIWRQAMGIS
jgi:hypothetical protein